MDRREYMGGGCVVAVVAGCTGGSTGSGVTGDGGTDSADAATCLDGARPRLDDVDGDALARTDAATCGELEATSSTATSTQTSAA